MNFEHLPKVELHLHLDCCLSYSVAKKIRPALTLEEYRESFIAPPKCTDLADYITRAIRGFELMQTAEHLKWVTLDLFEQLRNDQVIYAEMRFAPLQHIYQGLSPEQVVQAVLEAAEAGVRQTGVEARLILCTLRHYSEEQSLQTIALVEQFRGTRVAGFDIAADEAGFPITPHLSSFRRAASMGICCTAHAGEAKGAESVWETLENFKPSRIGHGVRSIEDPRLVDHLVKSRIHLEVCPTSNIQVNVFETMNDHPADRLYRAGVSLSINTDARTISDTTLTKEYGIMRDYFQWQHRHFLQCNLEAIHHAFIEDDLKTQLKQRLEEAYQPFI